MYKYIFSLYIDYVDLHFGVWSHRFGEAPRASVQGNQACFFLPWPGLRDLLWKYLDTKGGYPKR